MLPVLGILWIQLEAFLLLEQGNPKVAVNGLTSPRSPLGFYNHSLHSDLGKQASLNPLNMEDGAQISV